MSWTEARNTGHEDPFLLKKDNADAKVKYLTSDEDDDTGQYIVIYDDTLKSAGRIRWTIAHEIAHIVLGHLEFEETMSRGGLTPEAYKVLEKEADIFAAELLAPVTILKALNPTGVFSPEEIVKVCDISFQAATFRAEFIGQLHNYKMDESLIEHFSEFIAEYGLQNFDYEVAITSEDINIGHIEDDDTMVPAKRKGIPVDANNRFIFCPRCTNTDFEDDATHCTQCGEQLFNHCMNRDPDGYALINSCGAPASGKDKYCRLCGHETYLLNKGYLSTWQEDFQDKVSNKAHNDYLQLYGFEGVDLIIKE